MNRRLFNATALAAALVLCAAAGRAAADARQVLLANVAAGPAASSDAGAEADVVARVLASLAWGWRSPVDAGGFVALYSSASLQADGDGALETRETLGLQSRLSAGPGALLVEAAGVASWLCDDPSLLSSASIGYRLESGALEPWALLLGSWDVRPEGTDDVARAGVRLGVRTTGSVRLGVELDAGAAAESWYESDVYDAAGDPTGRTRRDVVTDVRLQAGGLAGYFTEWELGARTGVRLSDANRLAAGGVDGDAENRLELGAWGSVSWAPSRTTSLRARIEAAPSWYLGREALDGSGSLVGEKLRTLDVLGGIRADRALSRGVWLVLEANALATMANDPAEEGWSAEVRLGSEAAF
jgi:hypothetical protein